MWTEQEKQDAITYCKSLQKYGFNYRLKDDVRIVELLITNYLWDSDNNVSRSVRRLLQIYCQWIPEKDCPQHCQGWIVSFDNLKRLYKNQLD